MCGGHSPETPLIAPSGDWHAFPSQTRKAAKEMGKKGAFGVSVGLWPMGSWNRMIVCTHESGKVMVRSGALEAELG